MSLPDAIGLHLAAIDWRKEAGRPIDLGWVVAAPVQWQEILGRRRAEGWRRTVSLPDDAIGLHLVAIDWRTMAEGQIAPGWVAAAPDQW